jgi:sulfide:quinone oxidoreductase
MFQAGNRTKRHPAPHVERESNHVLARIVVLGAGLGGTIAAYEIRDATKGRAEVMVVSDSEDYWFVPSNPWVAVRWREPMRSACRLPPVMAKGHRLYQRGRARVHPENRLDLADGTSLTYDYLVIATGPDLAFDEIRPWPGWSHGVGVPHRPCRPCRRPVRCLLPKSAPIVVGAAQGASCFGPAYEFALILDTELRRRKIRDAVPMTFVTSEPYIGHLGLDGVGDTKGCWKARCANRHIKWVTNARITAVEAA